MEYAFTKHAQAGVHERLIKLEWIEHVLAQPVLREPDELDPELEHRLAPIQENEYRVLRVIVNKEREPLLVVTAYFDRRMRGKL